MISKGEKKIVQTHSPYKAYARIRSRQLELAMKGKVVESAKYATLAARIKGDANEGV